MALIAEILSRRSQQGRIGVWPRGASVRRTVGVNWKHDSSRKTTWASRCRASRRMRGKVSCFQRRMAGPAQTPLEDLADMLGVVGNAEVASDHFADAGRSPQVVGPAVPGGA